MTVEHTSTAIALLREAGCKVSHIIGHWPSHGIWHYKITLPDGQIREVYATYDMTAKHALLDILKELSS